MHAKQVCHKIMNNALDWMHTLRREALNSCILAATDGRQLSVTGLGRAIRSTAKEKHCIKRADRLLSNPRLYREHRDIYHAATKIVIGATRRPVILVDWSDLDGYKQHYLLRAAVALEGRSLTLYEEAHTLATKDKPKTHRVFLKRLKAMLATDCVPIVVTDAGFRTAWFKLVEQMGWDWVGRVRNRHLFRIDEKAPWQDCKTYYPVATTTPKYLGEVQLTQKHAVLCHLVIVKSKPKGRSKITRFGERERSGKSEQNAQREREPWLLATSLLVSSKLAKRVVNIYAARMQIEEAFRDTKSVQFGLGFELNRSYSTKRIQILLLIAMLAMLVLWLLGSIARTTGQYRHYQANTVKSRHVLSLIYLGLRVASDERFTMDHDDFIYAANEIWKMMGQYDFTG